MQNTKYSIVSLKDCLNYLDKASGSIIEAAEYAFDSGDKKLEKTLRSLDKRLISIENKINRDIKNQVAHKKLVKKIFSLIK